MLIAVATPAFGHFETVRPVWARTDQATAADAPVRLGPTRALRPAAIRRRRAAMPAGNRAARAARALSWVSLLWMTGQGIAGLVAGAQAGRSRCLAGRSAR